MALQLRHLDDDPRTRLFMRAEAEADITATSLYLGKYLSPLGCQSFPDLLLEAVSQRNDDWLINGLSQPGFHLDEYQRKKPKGGFTMAKVPFTAPQTLGEGEFNRFYLRGLCLRALEDGIESLKVVRVKQVVNARRESEQLLGTLLDAAALLTDLRAHPGVDTALGLPPGPNSGLSGELP